MSIALSVARRVNPVPAVIVGKLPESSMATPKLRPPLVQVVAAVLVTLLAAVVAVALFFAVVSSGDVVAIPLYSLMMTRRYPPFTPKVTVTVLGPALMFGA